MLRMPETGKINIELDTVNYFFKDPREERINRLNEKIKWLYEKLAEKEEKVDLPERYIINDGATILFWKDGSKTVVKRASDDEFNPRLAYLTAFFQRYCGMSKNKANKYLASLEVEKKKQEVEEKNEKQVSAKRGRPRKLKVGDKVRIRSDLEVGKRYGSLTCFSIMKKFKGKEVIISKIDDDGTFLIEEDNGWIWYDFKMIEGGK